MAGEWRTVQLAEIAQVTSGKRPPLIVKDSSPACPIPVIGGGGQSGFTSAALFDGGVLITGRVGTLGKLFAPSGPCWPSDNAFVIRPRSAETTPTFLRYALQVVIADATGMNRGAANPLITQGDLGRLVIHHPPLPEQRAIAHILGTLDDKIELNRRMSETLEQIARALFKAWFVDFEPVRAKMEGRWRRGQSLPGLPAHLYDLFPDRFLDSELGEIPEGWEIHSLDEIARFLNGLALQKYPPERHGRALPVIKIAQLRAGHTLGADLASADIDSDYVVEDGDVLFSWSGSLECVLWSGGRGALNQHLFKVTSDIYPKWFFYFWIHEHLPEFRYIAAGKATTMGHIQRHHLTEAKVVVGLPHVLNAADALIAPLFEQVLRLHIQSRTLAALRDALLPKLISGERRVKDAERFLEERGL